jgi:hypothetical protein
MIIIDLQQVMISNLMQQLGNYTNAQIDENMMRHMVLNTLRSLNVKFRDEYGELIICCDNTNVWRKKVFPYYKANRKKAKDASDLDWNSIFQCLNKIRQELKDYFPYRVIDIEQCEADDIIGTLTRTLSNNNVNVLIISSDKDFIQLHNKNVKQWDAIRKKWLSHPDPKKYLMEHIFKGDSGDGIPNILSEDNCFVVGTRQKPMTQKRIDALHEQIDSSLERNYQRNKMLVDLACTPSDLQKSILDQFTNYPSKDKSKLIEYFIEHRLKNLMESISEF